MAFAVLVVDLTMCRALSVLFAAVPAADLVAHSLVVVLVVAPVGALVIHGGDDGDGGDLGLVLEQSPTVAAVVVHSHYPNSPVY